MLTNDDRYHVERAAEILKEVYKEHIKDLPKVEEIKKRFLSGKYSLDNIAKDFDMKVEEVLLVLKDDINKKKKK